jgi:glycosyltransferase involved in cell wall biosynthesis
MKIVHLVTSGDVAGGQLIAFELARAARARGDDVEFVSPTTGPFLDAARDEGFPAHLADVVRTYRLDGAARLARLLRARNTDILHTHTHLAARVLGRTAARLAGARVVDHLHIENHFRSQRLPAAALRTLDNRTARLSSRLLAVSDATRHAFERQGYPPDLLETVPNGIDLSSVQTSSNGRLREELKVPSDAPLVGEIARLCDVKGQRELIEAAALVPDLRVALIGDDLESGGAYRSTLERDAQRLGVADRVSFTGHRTDAHALLGELDVFVLPSWTEGMPVVVLEAMARRKPVVATPVGGTPELVVDGETGVLVPPRDPQALAAAIRALVADPERARRLGEAGYARVAKLFSADAMTKRVLEVYDEIAAQR